jgi:triosephosphate isomerase (TIM)
MPNDARRMPLLAANWKMHKTRLEAWAFLDAFLPKAAELAGLEVAICPPFTALGATVERCGGTAVLVAAQNVHHEASGAFTGEISPPMLAEAGAWGSIVGHSERRQLFGETDDALARKVPALLDAGLVPILCVGETEEERDAGRTEEVLRRQIEADLPDVEAGRLGEIVIAYEPVWAIGTGRTATVEQAAEAIRFIRSLIGERNAAAPGAIRILYGGSVKAANAAELLGAEDIDGALVGGASLDPKEFLAICRATER